MMTVISSREFNQDTSRAKGAAEAGPVIITDRGEPAYVLLRHEEYRRLTSTGSSIVDMLAMDDGNDVEFEPSKLDQGLFRAADL